MAIETGDIAAFTTKQIQALTTDQIVAFTTAQIGGLDPDQIESMSMDQVFAFATDDIAAMSAAQVDALFAATPIMLDLDGNGISTRAVGEGARFDLNATGTVHDVGWVGANDGLLAMDLNGDGRINDGRELFGTGTRLADGSRAGNGYAALAQYDSNGDGAISADDEAFDELRVWVDGNGDAITDPGELFELAALGITSLDLQPVVGTEVDNGNRIGLVSHYETEDGARYEMADVWLAKQPLAEAATTAELLVAAPDPVLTDPQAAAPQAVPSAAAPPPVLTLPPEPAAQEQTPLI